MPAVVAGAQSAALVSARNVSKTFPGQMALQGVDLRIEPGEVHALVGCNGSGKSTLIKILSGVLSADPGAVIDGIGHRGHGASQIRCMHQDLGLVDGLNVVDNVALADGFRTQLGRVRWKQQRARTRELLGRVGLSEIDVEAPLGSFDQLTRIRVAMARLMGGWGQEPGLLILDEPTASLPESEAEPLFDLIREIRSNGSSVLYVSHRLAEVFDLADRVTVLRQGRVVHTGAVDELDRQRLVELMVGHAVSADAKLATPPPRSPRARLVIEGLTTEQLVDFSLTVSEGEIVGVAGVAGSGHDDVPRAMVGAISATGRIYVDGVPAALTSMTPNRALRLGLVIVPADRKREGILAGLSVRDNVATPIAERFRRRAGWLNAPALTDFATDWGGRVALSPPDPMREVVLLSGGNQQKVVLARSFASNPKVIVMSEPTAGVDVAAREQIWDLIRGAAAEGVSVVVTSTDLGDLEAVCHRLVVLDRGRHHGELHAPDMTEERIAAAVLESA